LVEFGKTGRECVCCIEIAQMANKADSHKVKIQDEKLYILLYVKMLYLYNLSAAYTFFSSGPYYAVAALRG